MIYVYFFLRSLCSLLPTHINFSWSRRFIQKCLKIARGCFFLPLFANPRIVLNFIPDHITQVNRVVKTLPVLPVYYVYIVLPLTFYLVAIPQLLNVLNFIPDLYPVVLNCFRLLFFIMVVTSAISLKLIVLWKLYPSCPFITFTLFCRSHFIWLLSRSCSTLSFGAV